MPGAQVLPPQHLPPMPRDGAAHAPPGLLEQRRADIERADAALSACAVLCRAARPPSPARSLGVPRMSTAPCRKRGAAPLLAPTGARSSCRQWQEGLPAGLRLPTQRQSRGRRSALVPARRRVPPRHHGPLRPQLTLATACSRGPPCAPPSSGSDRASSRLQAVPEDRIVCSRTAAHGGASGAPNVPPSPVPTCKLIV